MGHYKKSGIYDTDKERRNASDRRSEFTPVKFPIYTEYGTWVRKECRKSPDRRINNINVSEKYLLDDEFKELFKDYS